MANAYPQLPVRRCWSRLPGRAAAASVDTASTPRALPMRAPSHAKPLMPNDSTHRLLSNAPHRDSPNRGPRNRKIGGRRSGGAAAFSAGRRPPATTPKPPPLALPPPPPSIAGTLYSACVASIAPGADLKKEKGRGAAQSLRAPRPHTPSPAWAKDPIFQRAPPGAAHLPAAMSSRQDVKHERILRALLKLPDNRRCADCDTLVRGGRWGASPPKGALRGTRSPGWPPFAQSGETGLPAIELTTCGGLAWPSINSRGPCARLPTDWTFWEERQRQPSTPTPGPAIRRHRLQRVRVHRVQRRPVSWRRGVVVVAP